MVRPSFVSWEILLGAVAVVVALAAGCGRDGREHAIAADEPPRRLVSLAPSVTETVFALGLGERLVGVTRYCDFPVEAASKPKMGGYLDPNYEAIVAARPDVVLLIQDHGEVAKRLAALGVRTVMVNHQEVDGILESIATISELCGVPERGEDVGDRIRARLDAVARRVSGRHRPSALIVVGRAAGSGRLGSLWAAGQGSYYHDVLRLAGGENACQSKVVHYPELSREGLLSLDPEVIIDVVPAVERSGVDPVVALADWRDLRELRAVREGRVHVLGQDLMEIPGPRIADAVEAVAAVLHPAAVGGAG